LRKNAGNRRFSKKKFILADFARAGLFGFCVMRARNAFLKQNPRSEKICQIDENQYRACLQMQSKKCDFSADLRCILQTVEKYYPGFGDFQKKRIARAFDFAENAHSGQVRASGEPYFLHPIEATKILLSIRPDIETIIACLLHDVIEDTPTTADEIEKEFGEKVRFLCEGVEKVTRVRLEKSEGEKNLESLQKLFVAVARDIRVIFIKLADRIHNLRTLNFIPKKKQERIARESQEIYSHIAGKLGLFEFKTEILDLSFRFLRPEIFKKLSEEIRVTKKDREKILDRACRDISRIAHEQNLKIIDIHSRQKNLASVYEKIKRKGLSSAGEIFDLFGIRILVPTREDCYRALGILHSHWRPMPKKFKDYISVPKPNGYQALHTTILGVGKSDLPVEIQIKTESMHLDAEFGPAAHWAYKKAKNSNFDPDYLRRAKWVPQNITHETRQDPDKFFEELSRSILRHRIYVFTPRGDIKTLPAGATPVDFAYSIHTDIGHSCVGARVNGKIRPLDHPLKKGQVVEIFTKKGRLPNPLWLKFVKSSHARNHIRQFLNQQKIKLEPEPQKPTPPAEKSKKSRRRRPPLPPKIGPKIVIGSETGIPFHLAKCCNPSPEKSIIAFKSRGLECAIHAENCGRLGQLDPARFLEAHFVVCKSFAIRARDKIGLLRDLSEIITSHGGNIRETQFTQEEHGQISIAKFSIECHSEVEFKIMLQHIRETSGVVSVKDLTKK